MNDCEKCLSTCNDRMKSYRGYVRLMPNEAVTTKFKTVSDIFKEAVESISKNQHKEEIMKAMYDDVNKPYHYTQGIECIDYIESHKLGFHLGNAVKYITRAELKGDTKKDIKKAIWYLNRYLEVLDESKSDRAETIKRCPECSSKQK